MSTVAKCLIGAAASLASFTITYLLLSTMLKNRDTRRRKRRKKDPEVLGKVVEKHVTDDGCTFTTGLTKHGQDAVDAMRYAIGYKDTLEHGIGFYADNKLYESMTWNDVREAAGLPRIEEDDEIRPKRCAYCGCSTEKVTGTCEHCGAPL